MSDFVQVAKLSRRKLAAEKAAAAVSKSTAASPLNLALNYVAQVPCLALPALPACVSARLDVLPLGVSPPLLCPRRAAVGVHPLRSVVLE